MEDAGGGGETPVRGGGRATSPAAPAGVPRLQVPATQEGQADQGRVR